jgi:hypothetical protein
MAKAGTAKKANKTHGSKRKEKRQVLLDNLN